MPENVGSIIAWTTPESLNKVIFREALKSCDLDVKLAGSLKLKTAFTRACNTLKDKRIIRKVNETDNVISFQFTKEEHIGPEWEYTKETYIDLDKDTGRVSHSGEKEFDDTRDQLQIQVEKYLGIYLSSDMSRTIDRIIRSQGDLFPLKKHSSIYFVPEKYNDIIENIKKLLNIIKGDLIQVSIYNDPNSKLTICEAVTKGLEEVISEYEKDVDEFDISTKDFMVERMIEKLKVSKFKLDAYDTLLLENRKILETRLNELQDKLKSKVIILTE